MENISPNNLPSVTRCPDCESEYNKSGQGTYRCPKCYCKFTIESDESLKIIPYFEEIRLEPILIITGIMIAILFFSLGNRGYSVIDRVQLAGIFIIAVLGLYKLLDIACRRYRSVDRFFRKMSRFGYDQKGDGNLIKIDRPLD